jgi:hypothetical protein
MKGTLHLVFSACLFLLVSVSGISQSDNLLVQGIVKDKETLKKSEGIKVVVYQNGSLFDSHTTTGNGKYDFDLPLGFKYELKFEGKPFVSKKVRIDTRNVPDEDRAGGFQLDMDMTLFEYIDGFDTSILDKPIGIAAFDPIKNSIQFDFDYTAQIQKEIDAEFKRLDRLSDDLDKLREKFEELIQKGDSRMVQEKYADAVDKYEQALEIFPDDEPAQNKLAEAQKKLDEQNASAELEQRYQELIADGSSNMKKEEWHDALDNFKEASGLKPSERLPKDKIDEIEDILANLADRDKYDEILAEADGFFETEDYALSIDQYKAASKILPDEKYPRDQILEAQRLLDDLLANAAAREEIEKKYNDLIVLGDRNFKDKNYEDARRSFVEAGGLKPDERYPPDMIEQIDEILEELSATLERERHDATLDAERERIEKEYNALIDSGNEKFDKEALTDALVDYEDALDLKPNEKYPKGRIDRINEMLARADLADDGGDEEDDTRIQDAEDAAAKEKAERDRLAEEERQRRIQEEMDEKDRLAEERARLEDQERDRRSRFMNNVDRAKEDEVEKYYRDARESEEKAKANAIQQKKEDYESFLAMKDDDSREIRRDNRKELDAKTSTLNAIYRDADMRWQQKDDKTEKKKEKEETYHSERTEDSRSRRDLNKDKAQEEEDTYQRLTQNDVHRQTHMDDVSRKQESVDNTNSSYIKRGNALRADNEYDVDKSKKGEKYVADKGEMVRKDKVETSLEIKEAVDNYFDDVTKASKERREILTDDTEYAKETFESIGKGKESLAEDKFYDVQQDKSANEKFHADKELNATSQRYDRRKELFDKDSGHAKDVDDYIPVEGTEGLPEGVTENSYQLGNKIVIERTVKFGNKVDEFRKVVSKTGTYYFKNKKSISEVTWKNETLDVRD